MSHGRRSRRSRLRARSMADGKVCYVSATCTGLLLVRRLPDLDFFERPGVSCELWTSSRSRQKGLACVLIVGLLAWASAVSGVAAAASSNAADLGMASADFERCAAGADQRRHSRGPQAACSCCIPCRSDHLDELAGIPPVLPRNSRSFVSGFGRLSRRRVPDRRSNAAPWLDQLMVVARSADRLTARGDPGPCLFRQAGGSSFSIVRPTLGA